MLTATLPNSVPIDFEKMSPHPKGAAVLLVSEHFKIKDMSRRRAVVGRFSFAMIGAKRDKTHGFGFNTQRMSYKAPVIIENLDSRFPFVIFS